MNSKESAMTVSDQGPAGLVEKVTSWLSTQGYPLEMKVARALQEVGAHVIQSDYYVDPKTGVSREIDVVASWSVELTKDLIVSVGLTIECKGAKHKPWVMFLSNGQGLAGPARVAQRAASRTGQYGLHVLSQVRRVQDLLLFEIPTACGYSMAPVQDKSNDKDECFAALNGVAAAAAAQAALPDVQEWRDGTLQVMEIIFPVIVTEAPLLTASLSDASELAVTQVGHGMVSWRNPVVGLPHTLVHIVTAEHFATFAGEIAASVGDFFSMCDGELRPEVLQAAADAAADGALRIREPE